MAFECPSCKEKSTRLIAGPEKLGCDNCVEIHDLSNTGLLHKVRLQKYGVRMTYADANRIKTNKLRKDGRYRPDPRWRETGD
jgi:hypothetical protein